MSRKQALTWRLYKSFFSILLFISCSYLCGEGDDILPSSSDSQEDIDVSRREPSLEASLKEWDRVTGYNGDTDREDVPSPVFNKIFGQHSATKPVFSPGEPIPDWQVQSCLENMPPLLNSIYHYWKSGDMDKKDRAMPPLHHIILFGPPGTSKTTTAEVIAQSLGIERKVISGPSLIEEYRNQTAINIRNLFAERDDDAKKVKRVMIINEFHKLFEGHANQHSDHSENAVTFWESIDNLERNDPNTILIITANYVDKLPQEIKSRFSVQCVEMLPLDAEQSLKTFDRILANNPFCEASPSARNLMWAAFSGERHYAYRDISWMLYLARVFAYQSSIVDDSDKNVEQNASRKDGVVVLEPSDIKRALTQVELLRKSLKFGGEQVDDHERRHRESIKANLLTQARQKGQKSIGGNLGFNSGINGTVGIPMGVGANLGSNLGVNGTISTAPGMSKEDAEKTWRELFPQEGPLFADDNETEKEVTESNNKDIAEKKEKDKTALNAKEAAVFVGALGLAAALGCTIQ